MKIRKRRVIEWHDPRLLTHGISFVSFPFRLWKTEWEIREREVEPDVWELDVQISKKGKVANTGKKQIRPVEVWIKTEEDFSNFPEITFRQISPEWIAREKELLKNWRN